MIMKYKYQNQGSSKRQVHNVTTLKSKQPKQKLKSYHLSKLVTEFKALEK